MTSDAPPVPIPSPLTSFFADLVRAETRLYNALSDRLRAQHGIVTSQFEFLRHLRDHPGSRVADVAAEFAIGIGATSKGADRLEKLGLAQRQPNPTDRRSSLLALTEAGTRLVEEAERTFADTLTELVGDTLTSEELPPAAHALAKLRSTLEARQIGAPTG